MVKRADFLIVTALKEECDAILSTLSMVTSIKKINSEGQDIRIYYEARYPICINCKEIGYYNLIIMQLLGMGRVQGAIATSDAIRFCHPRYIILIGIAGGVAAKGIRLGDLLVSEQIVDYELQKLTASKQEIRWEVYRGDPALLNCSKNAPSLDKINLKSASRPTPGIPHIYFGPIASGDKVIAFASSFNSYRDYWNALIGVEMEAAGVAAAAFQSVEKPGFFMIRGVSDLADERKDSENVLKWRSYACNISALFTLHIINQRPIPFIFGNYQKKQSNFYARASFCQPIFQNHLAKLRQYGIKDKLVEQGLLKVFVREIDLSAVRNRINKQQTFAQLFNDLNTHRTKNLIIIGEAGIGKTTSLVTLAKNLANDFNENSTNRIFPIFLEMRRFFSKSGNVEDMQSFLKQELYNSNQKIKGDLLKELDSFSRTVFIFDGINEINANYWNSSIESIAEFIKFYSKHQYIISTRYYGFDEEILRIPGVQFSYYEIQRWVPNQIHKYFSQNGHSKSYTMLDPKIKNLCSLPFSAHLMLDIFNSLENNSFSYFPKNKSNLYSKYFEYIIARRDHHISKIDINAKLFVLSATAFIMNQNETLTMNYGEVEDDLKNMRIHFNIIHNEAQKPLFSQWVFNAVNESVKHGILKIRNENFLKGLQRATPIEFAHQSLQEYFTAFFLVCKSSKSAIKEFPINKIDNYFWRDVPSFIVGLLQEPKAFIEYFLNNKYSDDYLLIASHCLVSCNCTPAIYNQLLNKIVNDKLIKSLQNSIYSKDAIEIVQVLGKEAIDILLLQLDNINEIANTHSLSGNIAEEKRWRKYGRIIYILGELKEYRLISKIKNIYKLIRDFHLLYHISIALYSIGHDEANKILQLDFFAKNKDPIIRAFSFKSKLEFDRNNPNSKKRPLAIINALINNLAIQDEMSYAVRAHSAEALGILGVEEAIESLTNLLKNEHRTEPQSSAIKALGYIAIEINRKDILQKVIKILLELLSVELIYSNKIGIKLLKELLLNICTIDDVAIINNAIENVSKDNLCKSFQRIKRQILGDILIGLKFSTK